MNRLRKSTIRTLVCSWRGHDRVTLAMCDDDDHDTIIASMDVCLRCRGRLRSWRAPREVKP